MIIFVVNYSNKSLFFNLQDTKGMTCLHVAVRQGHADLIKLLLKTGRFDINEKVYKVFLGTGFVGLTVLQRGGHFAVSISNVFFINPENQVPLSTLFFLSLYFVPYVYNNITENGMKMVLIAGAPFVVSHFRKPPYL